ncbi:MAG: glucoamylase family protein [Elusimicrobiota bacterium]
MPATRTAAPRKRAESLKPERTGTSPAARKDVPISAALTRLAAAAKIDSAPAGRTASALESFYSGGTARPGTAVPAASAGKALRRTEALRPAGLIRSDKALLDDIQRRAFLFFWENTDPKTGLTRDRAANFEEKETRDIASIAATGFGLMALGVARSRGWITYEQAYERTLITLKGYLGRKNTEHGWSYHFMHLHTGERVGTSEVSSIDTALFLVGAVFAGRYFKGTEVERLAEKIYRRVDFPWMMTDGGKTPEKRTLSMGWMPEGGFLKDRWHEYSEHMILSLLAMGSPTLPLPPEIWHAWTRRRGSYAGDESIASGPLFTHQYSHMAVDFRGRRDRYADYFENSKAATLANRRFAIDQRKRYRTYGPDSWGLTASDGPDGYRAYGAPPGRAEHDGTVAPTAAGGSIVFTPELSIRALRHFMRKYGDRIWGRYGFSDAFNTDPRWKDRFNAPGMWRSPDVIGIDQGIMLLMIENLRTGLIWKTIMSSPHIRRGMRAAGLRRTAKRSSPRRH